jgi:hypothetical protein
MLISPGRIAKFLLILSSIMAAAGPLAAQTVSVDPAIGRFPDTTVGLASTAIEFVVTNTGFTTLTVQSIDLGPSQFIFENGWTPIVMTPRFQSHFSVKFSPDAAQNFSGTLTLNVTGLDPILIPLNGTGLSTGAIASPSATSIAFPNEPVGATAKSSVIVTNTGTTALTVTGATADPPFAVKSFKATQLAPGSAATISLTFAPSAVKSFTNALVISYDVVRPTGVSLSGQGTSAQALGVATFNTLPAVTVGSAYIGNLEGAGGAPPYTWAITTGALPTGLSLSSTGSFSGTVSTSNKAGSYPFTVRVTDSHSPPTSVTRNMTLPVTQPNGAACNNITTNIAGTGTPITPLNDLGTGTYLGSEGGLYPNGSNVRPPSFDAAGVAIAQAIQPLDADGNPDPNGKYALISIGESNTSNTYTQFLIDANADPAKNAHLVLVRGAQPRAGAAKFADPNNGVWNPIFQFYLPQAGVTANQVVAAWVESVDRTSGKQPAFPQDMAALQSEQESIARNLHNKFPNIKLVYYTSKFYDGYGTGLKESIYPEPYAYESGFAVKWAIQDQINGNANLNWDAGVGPVMAPWMSWANYEWANGLLARSDGLTWSCQDMKSDGVHPSPAHGMEKDSNLLLNFFKSDTTTMPWFLAHASLKSQTGK